MKRSIFQFAQQIAKANNCVVQVNGATYSMYDATSGGWRGSIDRLLKQQGIAKNYSIKYDTDEGYFVSNL